MKRRNIMEVKVISGRRVTIPETTAQINEIEKGDIIDISINKVFKQKKQLEAIPCEKKGEAI